MNTKDIITLARKHVDNDAPMSSSARLCLRDSIVQYDMGFFDYARKWAIKSLSYSVGVFHSDYQKAAL